MTVESVFLASEVSARGRRPNNEDRTLCVPDLGVYAVIDGVGGGPCGEDAAEITRDILRERLCRVDASAERRLREGFALANSEILRQSQMRPEMLGAGCVVVAAIFDGNQVVLAHVGDSRGYLLSHGTITPLTHDHSPVGEMERRGELTEVQARAHPLRHQVHRALGPVERDPDAEDFIEVQYFRIDEACTLLLSSDGLTDVLGSAEIQQVVESTFESQKAAEQLVERALEHGAKDNISVVLVMGSLFSKVPSVVPNFGLVGTERVSRRWPMLVVLLLLAMLAFGRVIARKPSGRNSPVPPRVWEVSQNPGGMSSIARAIEQARPGDTVIVRPGEYKESLQLKSGVAVVAEPRRGASLEPAGSIGMLGVDITDVRVSGFQIASPTGRMLIGVLLADSSVTLDDLDISGSRHAGVQLMGHSSDRLLHCRLHDNPGAGIRILDNGTPSIAESIITGNGQSTELGAAAHAELATSAIETVKDPAVPARFKHGR